MRDTPSNLPPTESGSFLPPTPTGESKLLYWNNTFQVQRTALEKAVFRKKTDLSQSYSIDMKEMDPFQLKTRAAHGLRNAFSSDDHIELLSHIKPWILKQQHASTFFLPSNRDGRWQTSILHEVHITKRIYLELIETCLHTDVKRCLENRSIYYQHFSFFTFNWLWSFCFLNTSLKPHVSPHQLICCFQLPSAPVFTQTGKNTECSS